MGQGSDTAIAQIVAEVLNIEAEKITVMHPDTDVTPYDMGTLGSRSTFHMGHAVQLAAEEALGQDRGACGRRWCAGGHQPSARRIVP